MIWRRVVAAAAVLVASAAPALAGPVFVALLSAGASLGSAFAATGVGVFLATTVGRLLTTVALTALQAALGPKQKPAGIVTETTQAGGTNPASFILGLYATGGFGVAPPMSHDKNNRRLTYVFDLGDIPITGVQRLILEDEYATVDNAAPPEANGYGQPIRGRFDGRAWLKVYDGTQTVADPMLRAKYGSAALRPWLADMVGLGVPYTIMTFSADQETWQGLPSVRFEVKGIKLYDPRKDSTVGGSGTQRWATPSTWTWSDNPMVMIYNILRGIPLYDGSVWGGGWQPENLPLDNWFAAMNACDETVARSDGGTERRYRAGYEVAVDDEPFDIIEELLKGCAGRIAFTGGQVKVRIGGPGLPVWFMTDDDVVRSRPEELEPFPGLAETYNAIHASYPEPESLWEAKDAPPRYNAGWEADDNDRRLVAELRLPTVPYATQVQRVMRAYIEEERRFRRHSVNLPPEAVILEPLDTISWTSARNGYAAKLFEVAQKTDDPMTMIQGVTLREVDPADYDWAPADELPSLIVTAAPEEPAPFEVIDFAVAPLTLTDGTSARRPAFELTWDGQGVAGALGLSWEMRLAGATAATQGTTQEVGAGRLVISEGVLPDTAYELRARLVADVPVEWTSWIPVTSPANFLLRVDLSLAAVTDRFETFVPGPFFASATPTGYVFFTYTHGPVKRGEIWRRGITFEMAQVIGSDVDPNRIKVELQNRRKPYGQAWGPWESLEIIPAEYVHDFGVGGYVPYGATGQFSSVVENIEYRLIVNFRPSGASNAFPWIRNINFVVAEQAR